MERLHVLKMDLVQLTEEKCCMPSVIVKAINKWRMIYQLKHHGKQVALQLRERCPATFI